MCLDPIKFAALSKEQDVVFNLPLDGFHLVVGPPGTGKSVVALHRAARFANSKPKRDFVILTKSRLLKEWTKESSSDLSIDSGSISTYHSWAASWHLKSFKVRIPKIEDYVYDWLEVEKKIGSLGFEKILNLIIDEGQDLPPNFYKILPKIAQSVTVFADENQTLSDQNSSLDQIQASLNLGKGEVKKLTKNYRNCRDIAVLSSKFYTGASTGIPTLPERKCPTGMPTLNKFRNRIQQAKYIHTWQKNNPTKKIGVFVPTSKSRDAFEAIFQDLESKIQVFNKDTKVEDLKLCEPGIFLTWFDNSKGLEFDHVFIPALEDWNPKINTSDLEKTAALRKLYVLTSRAKEQLHLMWAPDEGGKQPVVAKLLPLNFLEEAVG